MSAMTASPGEGLRLHGIGVRFGGLVALDDVSLSVPPGRILGIIGPNGAGKTTLFNVVCGFIKPSAGSMTWRGAPLQPRPHKLARLGIGRTLQSVGLFGGLTVVENVMAGATHSARHGFPAALLALPRSDKEEKRLRELAMHYLRKLRVAEFAEAYPLALPFAVQKQVALARALIAEPELLLLDEPAAGLSAEEIDELAMLVRGLAAVGERASGDRACSVMLVEHHVDLVMKVCDEIIVLDFGRVIAAGDPATVRDSAAVTSAYLGTAADIEAGAADAEAVGAAYDAAIAADAAAAEADR